MVLDAGRVELVLEDQVDPALVGFGVALAGRVVEVSSTWRLLSYVIAAGVLVAVAAAALIAGAALLYLAVLPAVRAVTEQHGDPATQAAYHQPLLDYLLGP